ncbi:helix-turn-helix domain-containing protein [Streptomyces albidoflavus]|uniref:helix-turn-helix domain-containing protein n=1 Tax=Streptomyces albidoflavus TaxID=1886 RepID=UPI0033A68C55
MPDAVKVLGLSRSVVYDLIRAGRLRTVKEGRTRLVPASAITDHVALLEREAGAERWPSGAVVVMVACTGTRSGNGGSPRRIWASIRAESGS